MTYVTYNSNGSPVVGWDTAEQEETEQQRFRRRYQGRRCVVCGTTDRWGRKAICLACWDSGQRYCLRCERVVSVTNFEHGSACCSACTAIRNAKRFRSQVGDKGHGGRVAGAIHRDRGVALARIVHSLVIRGWKWEEIIRHPEVTCPTIQAAKILYRRHSRKGTFDV